MSPGKVSGRLAGLSQENQSASGQSRRATVLAPWHHSTGCSLTAVHCSTETEYVHYALKQLRVTVTARTGHGARGHVTTDLDTRQSRAETLSVATSSLIEALFVGIFRVRLYRRVHNYFANRMFTNAR
jgi:hypothetical protein